MYRPYSLLAIALFAAFGEAVLRGSPAVAGDYANGAAALEAESGGSLTGGAKTNLGNSPTVPPAMFAALEELSKKSITDGAPTSIRPDQAARKPEMTGSSSSRATQVPPPPRIQTQRKAQPEQAAGLRARHANGPVSKIEALRERIQNAHSHPRRRGFHRAG